MLVADTKSRRTYVAGARTAKHVHGRRKTGHNRPKLPTGHIHVKRPPETISVELVEYKAESVSAAGVKFKYILTMMNHLTMFAKF